MRLYLDGPPHETCGWVYAALSEKEKNGALRAPFLHFYLRPQVEAVSQNAFYFYILIYGLKSRVVLRVVV